MNKKAQVAAEVMILFGFGFLMLMIFLIFSFEQISELHDKKHESLVEDLTFKIQKEILLGSSSRTGYERNFTLPNDLDQKDYKINIHGNYVYVESGGIEFYLTIPKVSGNLKKGENKIVKNETGIFINQ